MPEPLENLPPTPVTTPAGEQQPPSTEDLRLSSHEVGQPFEVAVLALQNLNVFPETVVPLGIGRPRSVAAVEAALSTPEKLLACITVRPDRSDDTDAKSADLFEVGTLVMIKRLERMLNGEKDRLARDKEDRNALIESRVQDAMEGTHDLMRPEGGVPRERTRVKRNEPSASGEGPVEAASEASATL